MINASAADAHRFGRVKRNGYDPVEVEAVVSRLIETLRTYESRTARLEERLEEADASADAIRQTFVAAQKTSADMLSSASEESDAVAEQARLDSEKTLADANNQADELTAIAQRDAAEVAALTKRLDAEVTERRDNILTEAYDEAESIATEAEAEAATRVIGAARDADALVAAAEMVLQTNETKVSYEARVTTMANSWLCREAMIDAANLTRNAEDHAEMLGNDARAEAESVRNRASVLRDAVANIEASARTLADVTSQEASVIDLSEIEAIESQAVLNDQHIDDAADDENAVRQFEIDEPHALTVAEARAEIDGAEDDGRSLGQDEPAGGRTYYQRSTGTPLSERVKIARMSR